MQLLTVLFTANLRGHLSVLPYLHMAIQQQRRRAEGPVLLLDLGDTCALDAWVCQATQGRAPFLVLDAMGYDGAVIGGPEKVPIPPSALRQLLSRIGMRVILWNREVAITKRGLTVSVAPGSKAPSASRSTLRVDRAQGALVSVCDGAVVLGDVPTGRLGCVEIAVASWAVEAVTMLAPEDNAPPDSSIAAVVELVEAEARGLGETGDRS